MGEEACSELASLVGQLVRCSPTRLADIKNEDARAREEKRRVRPRKHAVNKVLALILSAKDHAVPRLVSAQFVQFIANPDDRSLRKSERSFAWAVYVAHDPCHDRGRHWADRNTVFAVHRKRGWIRVIGRELPSVRAEKLALEGEL